MSPTTSPARSFQKIVAQRWHLGLRITGWNHVSQVDVWKSDRGFFEVSETEGS
jgi:hypothetical protein